MRSLPYSDLERGLASIAGIDPTNLLAHEKVLIAEYITDAVKYCWDYYPWPEFTKTEIRYFREEFVPNKAYLAGDEVYHNNAYYRARVNTQAETLDISTGNWYEVGDVSSATKWAPNGCYYIGARVEYDDKYFVCIAEPDDLITEYGNQPCCFEVNGIDPDDATYFAEISNNVFDRYIAYEQEGKDVIGTTLSVTLDDPRYNDTKPLNWREDREGIYIEPEGKSFNKVYLRYRAEAPTFTFQSNTQPVPKFLAQAIKAFAYKSWLIGDGQHEKAILQDTYGLDLLLREVDRLDLQQDRAQPYTITKNPYRRVNARQSLQANETTGQIAQLKESSVSISVKVSTIAEGINPVKKAYIDGDPIIDVIVHGYNAVKKANPYANIRILTQTNAENAVRYGKADSYFQLFTGIPFRGVQIGDVWGLKLNVVQESVQPVFLKLFVTNIGSNIVRQRITSTISGITTNVTGENAVKSANASASMDLTCSEVYGVNPVVQRNATALIQGILELVQGVNIVKKSDLTIDAFQFVVTASTNAFNAVKLANPSASISLGTEVERLRERSDTISADMSIFVGNGTEQNINLFTPSVFQSLTYTRNLDANSGFIVRIANHTPDTQNQYPAGSGYANVLRDGFIYINEFFDYTKTFKVLTKNTLTQATMFGKTMQWDDLSAEVPTSIYLEDNKGNNDPTPFDNIVLVSNDPIDIYLPALNRHNQDQSTDKLVQAYIIATPVLGGNDKFFWNSYSLYDDYYEWNYEWNFRLITESSYTGELVDQSAQNNTETPYVFIRSNNTSVQRLSVVVKHRKGKPETDSNSAVSTSKHGQSAPSPMIGYDTSITSIGSSNPADAICVEALLGAYKISFPSGEYFVENETIGTADRIELPVASEGTQGHAIDLFGGDQEAFWYDGMYDSSNNFPIRDPLPANQSSYRFGTTASRSNNDLLPFQVNVLPNGYETNFPQTFSALNTGGTLGTAQDYLQMKELNKSTIVGTKTPA